jgi:Flp pilus assembly protein TadD
LSWAARLAPSDAAISAEIASLQAEKSDQAIKLDPLSALRRPDVGAESDTASAHFAFAMQLKGRGDFQGAAGELLRSLSLEPARIDARLSLADAYVSLGASNRAVLEYYKILRSVPEDADAHLALGRLLLAQGDSPDGLSHLRLAVKYRPGSAEARVALDAAEKRPGKH